MNILLATTRYPELEEFISGLDRKKYNPVPASTGQEVLDLVGSIKPVLVILDENLPGCEPMELVRKIAGLDAMVNTAVITSMNRKEFHEKSEGLGVLAALPADPGPDDARQLILNLEKVFVAHTGT